MPRSKCKNCKRKLTEKNETSDNDTATAMASHHCNNNDSKENKDPMDPQRAWIRNVGPGSCKKVSYSVGKKKKSSQSTKTTLITSSETEVHHIDVDITAMMESVDLHSSTQIETVVISDGEDDTFSRPSTNKASKIRIKLDDNVKVLNDIPIAVETLESTLFNNATVATAPKMVGNFDQDDTMKLFNDVNHRIDNIVKSSSKTHEKRATITQNDSTLGCKNLDWTLPNNGTMAIVAKQKENLVQNNTLKLFTEVHSGSENIMKSTPTKRASKNDLKLKCNNLDWTLPNNGTVANAPKPKQGKHFVEVHMTEEKLNKLLQDGLIRLTTVQNGKHYYD